MTEHEIKPIDLEEGTFNQSAQLPQKHEDVNQRAQEEILRIFKSLNLPDNHREIVFKKFKVIRELFGVGLIYRNPDKLVPLVIYFIFKLRNLMINESRLIQTSKISSREFNDFISQITSWSEKNDRS